METARTNSKSGRRADRALIVLFIMFLWLPALDSLFHFDWAPAPSENRLLAAFPKWRANLSGLKEYMAGLDAYYNDHFGCRKCLIEWHNKLKNSLFHDKSARKVLVGSDGWLFLSDAQMIEHYRGALLLSPQQLRDWQTLLERRRDWLAQRGIKFLFVVAPDKHSIYPDQLPAWLKPLAGQTKLDQFTAYMREHSTVDVLDVRPALREARQQLPTYLKTDTHWNSFGAFVACQEVARTLAPELGNLKLLSLADFNYTNRPAPPGDLSAFAGVTDPEGNAIFFTPKASLPTLEITTEGSPLRPLTHVTQTFNHSASLRAVIYHDSFAVFWIPFLGYSFGHVTYHANNHLESNCFDSAVVEQEKPDVVIVEVVERYFNLIQPGRLL